MFQKTGIVKKISVALFVVFVAVSAVSARAEAWCGCNGPDDSGYQREDMMPFGGRLGLTDAQRAEARKIFQENRDAIRPLMSNLAAERQKLHELIFADSVDEAAIRAEVARVAGIQADLDVARAKMGAQFRGILTPEQVSLLKSMHTKTIRNMKGGFERPGAEQPAK